MARRPKFYALAVQLDDLRQVFHILRTDLSLLKQL